LVQLHQKVLHLTIDIKRLLW